MGVEKTVYILGAGASASANLPTQAGILKKVFSLTRSSFLQKNMTSDFLSLEISEASQRLLSFYTIFDNYRRELGEFIVSIFSTIDKVNEYSIARAQGEMIKEDSTEMREKKDLALQRAYQIVQAINVSLEDLFTVFDNVAVEREHFRSFSPQKMSEMHNKLKLCIIYTLAFSIIEANDCTDYERFSRFLINQRRSVSQKEDNLSIITMNWDDVLERTLACQCVEYNKTLNKGQKKILPDLCFYDYDFMGRSNHIPSTHIKAKGNKNIKILKMHGSLAWLECPKCGRIFTDYESEIACEEFGGAKCPCCKKNNEMDAPELRSLIITPTFMKSLENLNIKNIWYNALLDISEADHICFIGYSFPDADFEMRCLLKKAVKDTADITVVLNETNNPEYYRAILNNAKCDNDTIRQIIDKLYLPAFRYSGFFGEDRVKYKYNGFSKFLDELGV